MKYKVTLTGKTYEVEVEAGQAMLVDEYAAYAPAPAAPAAAPAPEGKCITAPVVGTFYMAPAPDQPPFVQVGDKVQKGQTVCLMEAMKMMSEVKAPCDCVIEAILQEDGALVSFGDDLIRYREG